MSNDILSSVGGFLHFVREMKFKGKKAGVFGCYGWSGEGNRVLREMLERAGFDLVEEEIKCNWNPVSDDNLRAEADKLATSIIS